METLPRENARILAPGANVDVDIRDTWPNNFCLGEAQCALASVQLKTLDRINDALIGQAMKIRAALADVPEISFAHIPDGYRHIFHQFVLHFDGSRFGKTRNDLVDFLANEARVRAIVQYHPLYRYPLFQHLGAGQHACPTLEDWWDNSFSLPWWHGIPDETSEYMVSSVKAGVASLKGK